MRMSGCSVCVMQKQFQVSTPAFCHKCRLIAQKSCRHMSAVVQLLVEDFAM